MNTWRLSEIVVIVALLVAAWLVWQDQFVPPSPEEATSTVVRDPAQQGQ